MELSRGKERQVSSTYRFVRLRSNTAGLLIGWESVEGLFLAALDEGDVKAASVCFPILYLLSARLIAPLGLSGGSCDQIPGFPTGGRPGRHTH